MTSTLCRSAALVCIIALWVVKIVEFFGIIANTVQSMVENVSKVSHGISVVIVALCFNAPSSRLSPSQSPSLVSMQQGCSPFGRAKISKNLNSHLKRKGAAALPPRKLHYSPSAA